MPLPELFNEIIMKKLLIVLFSFSMVACTQSAKTQTSWKSKHHDLSFTYGMPWMLLPATESVEKTLTGVIDLTDGTSYIFQIGNDVSKERLGDSTYFAGIRKTMLAANPKNRLISEDDTIYHGMKAHRQLYVLEAKRWGTVSHISYIIRTGQEFLTVQISYPIRKQTSVGHLPENLVRFDENVYIKMK